MRLFSVLAILILCQFNVSAQTTWYVPDDFSTIQGALDHAAVTNGDMVIVRPGTYVENINFLGKAITLTSEFGPGETVIDGNQADSVVIFQSGEGADSVLDGFTVANGDGHLRGGGIYCRDESSPTIMNSRIIGNSAVYYGGGISCVYSCSPTITNTTITGNSVVHRGGGINCWVNSSPTITNTTITGNWADDNGGGIYCKDESSPIITNTTITGNSAFYYGGGIHCDNSSSPTITNSTIAWNSVFHHGGGIHCDLSSPTITNTTITGNSAIDTGGGICCWGGSSPTITNTTITRNSAADYGGGITCGYSSSPTIANTILWDNAAPTGPGIWIGHTSHPSTLTIRFSDVEGGQSSAYVVTGGILDWGPGMIDSNPLFVDPVHGDFHLTFNSPCRGSGDNSAVTVLYDFEGDSRIYQGTVDIGADEFHPHLYLTGDVIPSGTIQAKFVGLPGTWIDGVIIGFNIYDPPLPCEYGLWYMDNPMQIITGLGTIPSSGVAVFPGTLPSVPPAPYTIHLQAVIDMGLTNLCTVNVLE